MTSVVSPYDALLQSMPLSLAFAKALAVASKTARNHTHELASYMESEMSEQMCEFGSGHVIHSLVDDETISSILDEVYCNMRERREEFMDSAKNYGNDAYLHQVVSYIFRLCTPSAGSIFK
jgi:hypothetical protein